MNAQVSGPLLSIETSLNALVSTLSTNPTFSTAPQATHDLLAADDALTSALITLRTHQSNHARLQRLRNEANILENRVREIVSSLQDLRTEAAAVGGEEEEASDEDDSSSETENQKEVDYQTLLSFARRIGRFNKSAADEAAADAASRRRKAASLTATNGATVTATDGVGITSLDPQALEWLNQATRITQAAHSMPFPSQDRIRAGLLGQLQATSEAEGEEAVERQVERLIATAEGREPAVVEQSTEQELETGDVGGVPHESKMRAAVRPGEALPITGTVPARSVQQPQERKTVALDLYDPDDDDD